MTSKTTMIKDINPSNNLLSVVNDDEHELQLAARAGMVLLEKNEELFQENKDLRMELEQLKSEFCSALEYAKSAEQVLENLKNHKRQSINEVNDINLELQESMRKLVFEKEKNAELLMKVKVLETSYEHLGRECREKTKELDRVEKNTCPIQIQQVDVIKEELVPECNEQTLPLPLPAMDHNDNELVLLREKVHLYNQMIKENEEKFKLLEKANHDLQEKNKELVTTLQTLTQEQIEERALLHSLRTMMQTYKKIADSRPFTDLNRELDTSVGLGNSFHEEISNENVLLREKITSLIVQVEELRSNGTNLIHINHPGESLSQHPGFHSDHPNESFSQPSVSLNGTSLNGTSLNGTSLNGTSVDDKTVDDKTVDDKTVDDNTSVDDKTVDNTSVEGITAARDDAIKRCQHLEEKLGVTKQALRKTKQQWTSAMVYQKELQECNASARCELQKLTEQLKYQMSQSNQDSTPEFVFSGSDDHRKKEEECDQFYEDITYYPAPPGDLSSPLIKCLLDNWTSDKARLMCLTDWLHHVIRGTGKSRPLKLERLPTEVAAGFLQLLIPVLRESHKANIQVFKRERREVITDLIIKGKS